jgi:hypothetical protein
MIIVFIFATIWFILGIIASGFGIYSIVDIFLTKFITLPDKMYFYLLGILSILFSFVCFVVFWVLINS